LNLKLTNNFKGGLNELYLLSYLSSFHFAYRGFCFILYHLFDSCNNTSGETKDFESANYIFLATIVCISIIAGSVAFSDYQKDKWFYDLKSQIKKEYPVVNNIECDITTPSPTLSLFIYCNKNADKDNIKIVFQTINNYLFNNISGSNPSQQSWLKRGQGVYTQIYICFYTDNTDKAEVTYFASYYTDGYRDKIDNFKT